MIIGCVGEVLARLNRCLSHMTWYIQAVCWQYRPHIQWSI